MAQLFEQADLIGVLIKCTNFAAIKHKTQKRKDSEKTPYINHPIGIYLCF